MLAFTNVKLSLYKNSIHDKNNLNVSKKFIDAIEQIEKEHCYFYDKQLSMKLEDVQGEYLNNIHYNMCDFMMIGLNIVLVQKIEEKYISEMKQYGLSLAKLLNPY